MTIEAQRADRDHAADTHERLIQRVTNALGPANDGAAVLNNLAFAQRLVAALLALRIIREHRAAEEQDQPKNEDQHPEKRRPR